MPVKDTVKPRGVGLNQIEWDRFDKITHELDMKPHALTVWAVRDFLQMYQAGEIKTKTETSS